ncbi:MAG: hypothetical protein WCI05_01700 [Myxococcales bacterium]
MLGTGGVLSQSTAVGSPFAPLIVQLVDSSGAPVTGVSAQVRFTVQPSGGASADLSAAVINTVSSTGIAQVNAAANGTAGAYTVVAQVVGGSASTTTFPATRAPSSSTRAIRRPARWQRPTKSRFGYA